MEEAEEAEEVIYVMTTSSSKDRYLPVVWQNREEAEEVGYRGSLTSSLPHPLAGSCFACSPGLPGWASASGASSGCPLVIGCGQDAQHVAPVIHSL